MHAEMTLNNGEPLFFWNVDATVGLHGVNLFDDVMFVQWCFYKASKWNKLDARLREVFATTPISGECTGHEGDMLISSIKALQQSDMLKGAMVDGLVSPAKGGHYKYHGGERTYLIFYLNAVLRVLYPKLFPRIDLMPEFIWRIRDKATAPFI